MPRWIERRGFTLAPPPSHAAKDLVRISLMERAGLVPGWFNVREARARMRPDDDAPELLSEGRALSWRWLREGQAEQLIDERLGTLRAMGYTLVGSQMGARGRWDWLYDLVHKRLAGPQPRGEDNSRPCPTDALRDALSNLGLSPDAVLEGVAAVLGISVTGLLEPEARTARKADPEQVAVLLPFLIHHERAEVREVGKRWLACPAITYQLPVAVIVQWLESDPAIASALAPRLETEGPALLGPRMLRQLSRTGDAPVRHAVRRWSDRLQ